MKVDQEVKRGAEKEEADGSYGVMCDLRDWVEETILYCHLAWQYHRLSRGPKSVDTWEALQKAQDPETGNE